VKHTYGHKLWTIPGGKVKKNEISEGVVLREIKEELCIGLDNILMIGSYETSADFRYVFVEVFHSKIPEYKFTIEPVEISEVGWFRLDELPENRFYVVNKIFDMLRENERS